jgi:hypothetical protein
MRAGGGEVGTLLGRRSTNALAELLGLTEEPQTDQEEALIEALRRRNAAP